MNDFCQDKNFEARVCNSIKPAKLLHLAHKFEQEQLGVEIMQLVLNLIQKEIGSNHIKFQKLNSSFLEKMCDVGKNSPFKKSSAYDSYNYDLKNRVNRIDGLWLASIHVNNRIIHQWIINLEVDTHEKNKDKFKCGVKMWQAVDFNRGFFDNDYTTFTLRSNLSTWSCDKFTFTSREVEKDEIKYQKRYAGSKKYDYEDGENSSEIDIESDEDGEDENDSENHESDDGDKDENDSENNESDDIDHVQDIDDLKDHVILQDHTHEKYMKTSTQKNIQIQMGEYFLKSFSHAHVYYVTEIIRYVCGVGDLYDSMQRDVNNKNKLYDVHCFLGTFTLNTPRSIKLQATQNGPDNVSSEPDEIFEKKNTHDYKCSALCTLNSITHDDSVNSSGLHQTLNEGCRVCQNPNIRLFWRSWKAEVWQYSLSIPEDCNCSVQFVCLQRVDMHNAIESMKEQFSIFANKNETLQLRDSAMYDAKKMSDWNGIWYVRDIHYFMMELKPYYDIWVRSMTSIVDNMKGFSLFCAKHNIPLWFINTDRHQWKEKFNPDSSDSVAVSGIEINTGCKLVMRYENLRNITFEEALNIWMGTENNMYPELQSKCNKDENKNGFYYVVNSLSDEMLNSVYSVWNTKMETDKKTETMRIRLKDLRSGTGTDSKNISIQMFLKDFKLFNFDTDFDLTGRKYEKIPQDYEKCKSNGFLSITKSDKSLNAFCKRSLDATLPSLNEEFCDYISDFNIPDSFLFFKMLRCCNFIAARELFTEMKSNEILKNKVDKILEFFPAGTHSELLYFLNFVQHDDSILASSIKKLSRYRISYHFPIKSVNNKKFTVFDLFLFLSKLNNSEDNIATKLIPLNENEKSMKIKCSYNMKTPFQVWVAESCVKRDKTNYSIEECVTSSLACKIIMYENTCSSAKKTSSSHLLEDLKDFFFEGNDGIPYTSKTMEIKNSLNEYFEARNLLFQDENQDNTLHESFLENCVNVTMDISKDIILKEMLIRWSMRQYNTPEINEYEKTYEAFEFEKSALNQKKSGLEKIRSICFNSKANCVLKQDHHLREILYIFKDSEFSHGGGYDDCYTASQNGVISHKGFFSKNESEDGYSYREWTAPFQWNSFLAFFNTEYDGLLQTYLLDFDENSATNEHGENQHFEIKVKAELHFKNFIVMDVIQNQYNRSCIFLLSAHVKDGQKPVINEDGKEYNQYSFGCIACKQSKGTAKGDDENYHELLPHKQDGSGASMPKLDFELEISLNKLSFLGVGSEGNRVLIHIADENSNIFYLKLFYREFFSDEYKHIEFKRNFSQSELQFVRNFNTEVQSQRIKLQKTMSKSKKEKWIFYSIKFGRIFFTLNHSDHSFACKYKQDNFEINQDFESAEMFDLTNLCKIYFDDYDEYNPRVDIKCASLWKNSTIISHFKYNHVLRENKSFGGLEFKNDVVLIFDESKEKVLKLSKPLYNSNGISLSSSRLSSIDCDSCISPKLIDEEIHWSPVQCTVHSAEHKYALKRKQILLCTDRYNWEKYITTSTLNEEMTYYVFAEYFSLRLRHPNTSCYVCRTMSTFKTFSLPIMQPLLDISHDYQYTKHRTSDLPLSKLSLLAMPSFMTVMSGEKGFYLLLVKILFKAWKNAANNGLGFLRNNVQSTVDAKTRIDFNKVTLRQQNPDVTIKPFRGLRRIDVEYENSELIIEHYSQRTNKSTRLELYDDAMLEYLFCHILRNDVKSSKFKEKIFGFTNRDILDNWMVLCLESIEKRKENTEHRRSCTAEDVFKKLLKDIGNTICKNFLMTMDMIHSTAVNLKPDGDNLKMMIKETRAEFVENSRENSSAAFDVSIPDRKMEELKQYLSLKSRQKNLRKTLHNVHLLFQNSKNCPIVMCYRWKIISIKISLCEYHKDSENITKEALKPINSTLTKKEYNFLWHIMFNSIMSDKTEYKKINLLTESYEQKIIQSIELLQEDKNDLNKLNDNTIAFFENSMNKCLQLHYNAIIAKISKIEGDIRKQQNSDNPFFDIFLNSINSKTDLDFGLCSQNCSNISNI